MAIKPEVQVISDFVKDQLTIGENGIITVAADAYEKSLPEGMTMEPLLAHLNHRDNFIAGCADAAGAKGVEIMKADKTVTSTSFEAQWGTDVFGAVTHGSRSFPDPQNPEGDKIVKYGATTLKYTAHGAQNKGQLKQVFNGLSALAEEALK